MTNYYVVNDNGDWWVMNRESRLFVVAVDDVKIDSACESLGIEREGDKFEQVLWNCGEIERVI